MTTLVLKPSREKKAYRLRCRFKIEPFPRQKRLDIEKVRVAERFVSDMHKQGWENAGGYEFTIEGPFPMVTPVTIHRQRPPTARKMMYGLARGERFLDRGSDSASMVLPLALSEWWEYEIAGVFIREQILTEYPDAHEEELR